MSWAPRIDCRADRSAAVNCADGLIDIEPYLDEGRFRATRTTATCAAQSMEKKLADADEKSFMKKCEADAKATCEASAKEKKLAGAAQTSFVKKC